MADDPNRDDSGSPNGNSDEGLPDDAGSDVRLNIAAAWLDEEASVEPKEDNSHQNAGQSELSPAQQRHVADLQLVDALLNPALTDAASVEQRVGRVMRSLSPAAELSVTRDADRNQTNYWQRMGRPLVALAASVMLLAALIWPQISTQSHAAMVLRQMRDAAAKPAARVYRVSRGDTLESPGSEVATLYLRGQTGMVLRAQDIVFGRTDRECWLVPPEGDVLVANDFRWLVDAHLGSETAMGFLNTLTITSRDMPIIQLPAVMEALQEEYRVRLTTRQTDAGDVHRISAMLQQPSCPLPESIILTTRPGEMIIAHAGLHWQELGQVSLDLNVGEPIPDGWFSADHHAKAGQRTRRLD